MSFPVQMFLVITLVVAATDLAVYSRLKLHPDRLSLPFTLSVIFITMLPIAIMLLKWHLEKRI